MNPARGDIIVDQGDAYKTGTFFHPFGVWRLPWRRFPTKMPSLQDLKKMCKCAYA